MKYYFDKDMCRGLVNRGSLYHAISQYKTNLVLSLKDSVTDLENVVQLWGHSAQQQRLDIKIEDSSHPIVILMYI